MKTVRQLHDRAMSYADDAWLARRNYNSISRQPGDLDTARIKSLWAMAYERKAASLLDATPEHEPSRSVLYRSAAWLAVNADCHVIAEQLALAGLDGHPPTEIRRELEDVLAAARSKLITP